MVLSKMDSSIVHFVKEIKVVAAIQKYLSDSEALSSVNAYLTPKRVLIGIACGLALFHMAKKRHKIPPGPMAIPFVGNIELFRVDFFHDKFNEYEKKYGPVFTIQFGPIKMVVVNDLQHVNEALITSGADFANRMRIFSMDIFSEGGKDIAFADCSPAWKLHRKIVSKAFRTYLKSNKLEGVIQRSMEMVIPIINGKNNEAFNPTSVIDLAVFNIICALCFDTRYSFDDTDFIGVMKADKDLVDALGIGLREDVFPYLVNLFPSARYTTMLELLDYLFGWINKHIAEHKESFKPDSGRDFTDHMLQARQEAEHEEDPTELANITDVHLRQTIVDIFFAGIDTSRSTLYWAILLMAAYPEVQKKCQDEIDAVVGKDRLPAPDDKKDLQYVDATLHEVMRFRTVLPLGLPHEARVDSKLGGYDIPKGMTVMINHHKVHMSDAIWKNPDVFDPNRFLDAEGNLTPTQPGWLPFSAGRRVCLGETIAKPNLVTLLATFLQQFRITPPAGEKADIELGGNSFMVEPKDYKVVMTPRK